MVEGKSIRQQMKDERTTGNGVVEGQVGESEREGGGRRQQKHKRSLMKQNLHPSAEVNR